MSDDATNPTSENPVAEPEKPMHEAEVTLAGFVFNAEAAKIQYHYAPVLLTLMGESTPQRLIVESNEVIIGRSKDCDFSLADNTSSRQHAKLVYTNANAPDQKPVVHLHDLKSRNGVLVNGVKVNEYVPLRDNARIQIGETQMGYYVLSIPKRVEQPAEAESPAPQAPQATPAPAAADASPRFESAPSSQRPAAAVAVKNLVIVDHDFEFASKLRERLTETGRYRVVVYRRLENALGGGGDGITPHMLLLDGDMQGEASCTEMCQRVKTNERWKSVPIILLFDKFEAQLVREALKAGAQSYLTKPIENLSQLTNRIDIHMNINRMMSSMPA